MEVTQFFTNDLSFAAYLIMHKVKIIKAQRLGRSFRFIFEKSDEIEKLRMLYPTSESSAHDDAVRKLKKLLYGDDSKE